METIATNSINQSAINQLIRSRRSVFLAQVEQGKKIPDEIIWELLENANTAPTHKRTEPWRFVVFTGEGLKKFAAFQASVYLETAGSKFSQDKYNKLLSNPPVWSHVIAICMHRSETVAIPEVEEICAVACAVENMYIAASAYGLACYWSTGGVTYQEEAKPFFELRQEDRLLGFFYLGCVSIEGSKSHRSPVKEKTRWVDR